jgi:hypothetical protein
MIYRSSLWAVKYATVSPDIPSEELPGAYPVLIKPLVTWSTSFQF